MRQRKTVMILGCGPAGLFAAQAAMDLGYPVAIFSKRRKSQMFGAQYLHGPVPNIKVASFPVTYRLQGTALGYSAKVYGPERAEEMRDRVSPATILGTHRGWDIRQAYDTAWDRFEARITDVEVTPGWLKAAVGRGKEYSLVVSSIPAIGMCAAEFLGRPMNHRFDVANIWAVGDAPERAIACPVTGIPENTVLCNGESSPGWYRASNINGFRSAEWPGHSKPPLSVIAPVSKPLATDCDCWQYRGDLPLKLVRVGRYGTWTKGELSHSAYQHVWQALS